MLITRQRPFIKKSKKLYNRKQNRKLNKVRYI